MIGATPAARLTYDCRTRASAPTYRSRTMATTSTWHPPAPAPIRNRQSSSASNDRAKAAHAPQAANTAQPASSTGRRPRWSESGPATSGAIP
jgi:hypothetical protein